MQPLQTPGLNKVLQNACLDLDPNCLNDNVDGISERISFGKINFEKKMTNCMKIRPACKDFKHSIFDLLDQEINGLVALYSNTQ